MTKPYVRLWAVALLGLALTFTSFNGARAAEEGGSGEIGVPMAPVKEQGRFVDGAVMAPDGKHFYTLYEGLLSKISIKPFKRVSSWEIDFKEILSPKNLFKVFITPDEKKLIISNKEKHKVVLVEVGTGAIINSVPIKKTYRTADLPGGKYRYLTKRMIDAVLNDHEFLVFKTNKIIVFDANTLSKKREVSIDWKPNQFTKVHKIYDKIIYGDEDGVGFIGKQNYRNRELYRYGETGKKEGCGFGNLGGGLFNFDLNSLEDGAVKKFNICGYPVENSNKFSEERTIDLGARPISVAGHYVVKSYEYTLKDLSTSKKYEIAQYPDGAVILLKKSDPKHFVTLTPKARKHLKMKTAEGEVVPINDATFDKYQIPHP